MTPEELEQARRILQPLVDRALAKFQEPVAVYKGLDELTGLIHLKKMIKRDIKACLAMNEVFPHTGLFGPGGLGKTTVAQAMSKDLGYYFVQVEGAAIKTRDQLIGLLRDADQRARCLKRHLLFFVDECHRLGSMQEVLYYPMSEWRVTTSQGSIGFKPFTLVAATTHPNMLMSSFTTRLQNQWYMEPYELWAIRRIVASNLDEWGMSYDYDVVNKISLRSLGIPRNAIGLAKKVRNSVLAQNSKMMTSAACDETFALEGIDEIGLGPIHVRYLMELFNAQGVPKGLSAVAGRMGLSEDVVSGSIEPVLLNLGLIDLSCRGRVLTPKGHLHLAQSGRL